jgi:hypothetical protein
MMNDEHGSENTVEAQPSEAQLVPIVPWGSGSEPPVPSVDDDEVSWIQLVNSVINVNISMSNPILWLVVWEQCGCLYDILDTVVIAKISGRTSSSISLRSSTSGEVEENGRTYHRYKEGSKSPSPLVDYIDRDHLTCVRISFTE